MLVKISLRCTYAISKTLGVYLQFPKTPGVYSEFSLFCISDISVTSFTIALLALCSLS
jgi:hypothetical protein